MNLASEQMFHPCSNLADDMIDRQRLSWKIVGVGMKQLAINIRLACIMEKEKEYICYIEF